MKGGSLLPVLLIGIIPLLVIIAGVGIAIGLVRWGPPLLWSNGLGASDPNVDNKVVSVSTTQGGFYAVGFTGVSASTATMSSLFLNRYDSSGRDIWSQSVGAPPDEINRVVSSTDGVYVAGDVNSTVFVEKRDLQGNEVWNDRLASLSDVYDLSLGGAGVYATVLNRTGGGSGVLLQYGFDGKVLWTTMVESGVLPSLGLFVATNGVYVSGYPYAQDGFVQRYDFNGTLDWSVRLACSCEPEAVSGDASGIYVAGFRHVSGLPLDAFLAKYDWNGNQVWLRQSIAPQSTVRRLSMSVNFSGVYVVMNSSTGDFLLKYDGNGNEVGSSPVPFLPYTVSASENGVYVGGGTGENKGLAVLAEFSQSASLIFFGLNPPFSFAAVGVPAAAAGIGVLWYRKPARTRLRAVPKK